MQVFVHTGSIWSLYGGFSAIYGVGLAPKPPRNDLINVCRAKKYEALCWIEQEGANIFRIFQNSSNENGGKINTEDNVLNELSGSGQRGSTNEFLLLHTI